MEIYNYCNQCKKSLSIDNFDKKKNNKDYYTRCKKCRETHNKTRRNYYKKKSNCGYRTLCNNNKCKVCFNKSFASYEGKTI